MSLLRGNVLARRVPVSTFWRYRVSLQRKKCCQQIIGLNDESFSIAVRIDAKKKSVLGNMFGDAVRPALCAKLVSNDLPVFHLIMTTPQRYQTFVEHSITPNGMGIEVYFVLTPKQRSALENVATKLRQLQLPMG